MRALLHIAGVHNYNIPLDIGANISGLENETHHALWPQGML